MTYSYFILYEPINNEFAVIIDNTFWGWSYSLEKSLNKTLNSTDTIPWLDHDKTKRALSYEEMIESIEKFVFREFWEIIYYSNTLPSKEKDPELFI